MKKGLLKTSTMLVMGLITSSVFITTACADQKQLSYEDLTKLNVSQETDIINPSKDITTTYTNYYLTGSSNPNEDLYINGEIVTNRGKFGSFGVYVPLQVGSNYYKITQGNKSDGVNITRVTDQSQLNIRKTKSVTSMFPVYNYAVDEGQTIAVQCTAPSGAYVFAYIDGNRVELKQVAQAMEGVPAVFKGNFVVPQSYDYDKTTNAGKVEYYLNYGGKQTSWQSNGDLFVVGSESKKVVEVISEEAVTFNTPNFYTIDYNTVLPKGTVDTVIDSQNNMYKLEFGGWISQKSVSPIAGYVNNKTQVNDVNLYTSPGKERYVFETTSNPAYKGIRHDNSIEIRLYNTVGIDAKDMSYYSELFDSVDVSCEGTTTILMFNVSQGKEIWGYNVDFTNDNTMELTFTERPQLSSSSDKPLENITVGLDPGHGGRDSGAIGVQGTKGPMEKNITLATAYVTKSKLEQLGATVIMTRTDDTYSTLDQRLEFASKQNLDFFLSIHINSTAANRNGQQAKGVEVYYNDPYSQYMADRLFNNISDYTNRVKRNCYHSHYIITLNTYAPSALMELAFMPNPIEYDDICSQSGMEKSANAIVDSILQTLKK